MLEAGILAGNEDGTLEMSWDICYCEEYLDVGLVCSIGMGMLKYHLRGGILRGVKTMVILLGWWMPCGIFCYGFLHEVRSR